MKIISTAIVIFIAILVFMGCNSTEIVEATTAPTATANIIAPTPLPTGTPIPDPTLSNAELEEIAFNKTHE